MRGLYADFIYSAIAGGCQQQRNGSFFLPVMRQVLLPKPRRIFEFGSPQCIVLLQIPSLSCGYTSATSKSSQCARPSCIPLACRQLPNRGGESRCGSCCVPHALAKHRGGPETLSMSGGTVLLCVYLAAERRCSFTYMINTCHCSRSVTWQLF